MEGEPGGSLADAWERCAQQWIRWARTPGHDAFRTSTWPELQSVLPTPSGLTLDLGAGEGRVTRQLLGDGHRVVAVERSTTLARAAATHDPVGRVVQADAARLPLRDSCVDLVVACMSLQDVDDLHGSVREMARVLAPKGCAVVAIVHPFASAEDPVSFHDNTFVLAPYLQERRYLDHVERNGVEMTFESMHRPLRDYIAAFAEHGLLVDALRERGDRSIPWLMVLRLRRC